MLLLKQWNFQSSVFVMVSSIVGSLVVLTNKYIWNILIKAHNIKPISAQALTRKTNRSHKEFCFFMKQKIIIIFKTMNNNIISKMKRKKTKQKYISFLHFQFDVVLLLAVDLGHHRQQRSGARIRGIVIRGTRRCALALRVHLVIGGAEHDADAAPLAQREGVRVDDAAQQNIQ